MKRQNKKFLLTLWLLASLVLQTAPLYAQNADAATLINADETKAVQEMLRQARGDASFALLERIFAGDASAATDELASDADLLFQSVSEAAHEKAKESLDKQIEQRKAQPTRNSVVSPVEKTKPVTKPKTKQRKLGFHTAPPTDWRQLVFGFQPLPARDEKPEIKMTETDKEIKASGENRKSFETKEAKGTRTQKAETKYTKDGKTFGVEIKNTEIIEAVSKADGKSFRKEISLVWGAEVAACPDANGVSAGTGKARVVAKTIYTENGETILMTSEFDLQAKLTGYVNDRAEMINYDFEIDAYTTNSGYETALGKNIIKEIKIKDGRYGLHYDIKGNTIEVSDGKYGGYRKPAKMGKAEARKLTPMNDAETKTIGSAIGSMIPSIWNSANEMYKSAERNWQNYGCVEVVAKAPKTILKAGEEISVSAETIHLQDGAKINAELEAEAYLGQISPEKQSATPSARFTFTQEGEEKSTFYVTSISKRGIGRGDVEFQAEKEKEEEPPADGIWTGTIRAERKRREEREKRSGANLAENGGYMETVTDVQLQLTARRDTSGDATNAFFAQITGAQETTDFEYDRYKVDEGYCGANAVPYKGPKEITRTSTTTVNFNGETRVYASFDRTSGSLTFSLPETPGKTVHSYVHKSPCADHDRANTNKAFDEDAATPGGSFSISFPLDAAQKSVKGSLTVRAEDGEVTIYTWELTRR